MPEDSGSNPETGNIYFSFQKFWYCNKALHVLSL